MGRGVGVGRGDSHSDGAACGGMWIVIRGKTARGSVMAVLAVAFGVKSGFARPKTRMAPRESWSRSWRTELSCWR